MNNASAAGLRPWRTIAVRLSEFLVVAFCTLAFALTLLGVLHSILEKNAAGKRDFVEYWSTSHLLAKHVNPYDSTALLETERGIGLPADVSVMVLPNPPIALLFVAPLDLLPAATALWVWCFALVLCLGVSVAAVRRVHSRSSSTLDLLGYSFAPVLCCLLMGQMSMFILLGLALFLVWNNTRPIAAGCALCLCLLKPHLLLPFAVVLLVWAVQTSKYRLLVGSVIGLTVAIAGVLALDHHAFAQYSAMMAAARVDKTPIPCLSNALRRAIAPDAMWLQYLPAALGSIWALEYYRRRRNSWDWASHGSLLALVSFAVAPYSWLTDQCVLVPVILHGLYVTRSRAIVAALSLASAVLQLSIFGGGTRLMHSPLVLWTVPVWIAWYILAVQKSDGEPSRAAPAIAAEPVTAA
jgi:hypothetical protein